MESIAGAILIDSRLNLEEVWRIFMPILSPIVTPDKLELPPLRELVELCDSLGLFVKDNCITKGAVVFAELSVQLKDTRLIREGSGQNRKAAKAQAALQLLKDLEVSLDLITCSPTILCLCELFLILCVFHSSHCCRKIIFWHLRFIKYVIEEHCGDLLRSA